jgi:uncharacterized protein YndB with AHSA1/START domain
VNHKEAITVQTTVKAPIPKIWECWNRPEHITGWAFESNDWEVPAAENDLRVGGRFKIVTAAKSGGSSVDFIGTYVIIKDHQLIEYILSDERHVKVEFEETPEGVRITETFDPENENPEAVQRSSWQATLDNFKTYVENKILPTQP